MFNIDASAVQALITATGSAVWSFAPIIALYLGLPVAFYVIVRIRNMFPNK